MNLDIQSMKTELERLLAGAQTDADRVALEAFVAAVAPSLDDPRKLSTMLSKIQTRILSGETQDALDQGDFASLDDLVAIMPADVSVRLESSI